MQPCWLSSTSKAWLKMPPEPPTSATRTAPKQVRPWNASAAAQPLAGSVAAPIAGGRGGRVADADTGIDDRVPQVEPVAVVDGERSGHCALEHDVGRRHERRLVSRIAKP